MELDVLDSLFIDLDNLDLSLDLDSLDSLNIDFDSLEILFDDLY